MLKETETDETKVFFCRIFILDSISIGGGPPLATSMPSGSGPE